MGRLLFILFIVALVVWLLKRAARRAEAPPAEHQAARTSEELVRCVQCGVLLPRAEARMSAGALYCSEEHARLGPAPRKGAR